MRNKKTKLAKVFSLIPVLLFIAVSMTSVATAQWKPGIYDSTRLPKKPLYNIISDIAFWLLAIFGFIAIIGFVISGIMYLIAAGDEDRQEQAKRAMYYSITGVIVGLVGLVVIYAVTSFLGGSSAFGIPSGTFIPSSSSSSSVIKNAADSPATGATTPSLPSGSGSGGTNWAPTSDMYTSGGNPAGSPDATRPEYQPF